MISAFDLKASTMYLKGNAITMMVQSTNTFATLERKEPTSRKLTRHRVTGWMIGSLDNEGSTTLFRRLFTESCRGRLKVSPICSSREVRRINYKHDKLVRCSIGLRFAFIVKSTTSIIVLCFCVLRICVHNFAASAAIAFKRRWHENLSILINVHSEHTCNFIVWIEARSILLPERKHS
jgi:hypothetical protein